VCQCVGEDVRGKKPRRQLFFARILPATPAAFTVPASPPHPPASPLPLFCSILQVFALFAIAAIFVAIHGRFFDARPFRL